MRLIIFTFMLAYSSLLLAEDIASCSKPSGKAYYLEYGLVSKKDSGWEENEKISAGITKLSKVGENTYDILFVDTRNQIISSTEDGGKVLMVSGGKNIASFLVIYPGKTTEIYTFLKNNSGINEYIHITSRASDAVLINKASLMRGECHYIKFDKL
jgi:hypothetical protein